MFSYTLSVRSGFSHQDFIDGYTGPSLFPPVSGKCTKPTPTPTSTPTNLSSSDAVGSKCSHQL